MTGPVSSTLTIRRRPHEALGDTPDRTGVVFAPEVDLATGRQVGEHITVTWSGVTWVGRISAIDADWLTVEVDR